MKQLHPIEKAVRILIIAIFAITCILSLASCADSKTPMDRHVEYILEKHNGNCQYEQGECPQFECSHYPTH